MTWIEKRVINIDTMIDGIVIDENNWEQMILTCKMNDGSIEKIIMNNICHSREHEVATQEKYKQMFWVSKGKWIPYADTDFIEDPKQLWINWSKLDPSISESEGYKAFMKEQKEITC